MLWIYFEKLIFGEGDTESCIRHIMKYRKPVIAAAAAAVCAVSVLAAVLLTVRPDSGREGQTVDSQAGAQDSGRGDMGQGINPGAGRQQSDQADDSQNVASGIGGQDSSQESAPMPPGAAVTVNDLVVEINGTSYDMAELCGPGLVNAITDISEFEDYVVVQGHINPSRSFYGVFNTDAQKQQYFYIGGCLTWDENWEQLDDPVESVIYAEQSGPNQEAIRNWKEEAIAIVDLKEGEYIRDLSRTGDDITVSICTVEGGRRELSFDYQDSCHTLYHW